MVELSAPGYQISNHNYQVQHAQSIGAQVGGIGNGLIMGDAWWHDNWAWGGLTYPPLAKITAISATPIDDLSSTQSNQQTFTASGPYRTVCVTVTSFSGLKSDADSAGDGNAPIGGFIAQHPIGDGVWWNVISQSSCAYVTWIYANGYQIPDTTQLW
ncbi:MAG: hypothetical protein ACREAN_07925 [Nitrosopumilaceae archaeon]